LIQTEETKVEVEKKGKGKAKKSPAPSKTASASSSKEATPSKASSSKAAAPSSSFATSAPIREKKAAVNTGTMLWTEKYKPKAYDELIGNNVYFEKVKIWLRDWEKNVQDGFPKKGEGSLRAVLFSGPPGIGWCESFNDKGKLLLHI
jgi:replication factor C subunit 1